MSQDIAPPQPWGEITVKYATRVLNDLQREGGSILIEPLWPVVIGLIERNCLPGREVHPHVRPLYAQFLALVADEPGHADDARYTAWLAGDISVDNTTRDVFAARFKRSRGGDNTSAK